MTATSILGKLTEYDLKHATYVAIVINGKTYQAKEIMQEIEAYLEGQSKKEY